MGEIRQSVEVGHYGKWIRVNAIFDSGAEISFLNKRIADKINAPQYSQVSTILGDGRKTKGYLSQINVKIQNRVGLADVIIIEGLDGDLLIGQDWMQKNDIVLDMRDEKFRYGTGQPRLKKVYRLR